MREDYADPPALPCRGAACRAPYSAFLLFLLRGAFLKVATSILG